MLPTSQPTAGTERFSAAVYCATA